MFTKIFALFALLAVAFAAPEPKPVPDPQVLAYTGLEYAYPAVGAPVVSPYAASPYAAPPYAAPVYTAYSAYPGGAYFVRK